MIVALETSTFTCHLAVYDNDAWHPYEWEAGRGLAKGLLGYLQETVSKHGGTLTDLEGIIAYQGPGSFTGLRIGLTILNTIADAQRTPIVGVTGEDWLAIGLARLQAGENDELVMPEYGSEPNITTPRK